ncbi:THUMP-like domain-containing protein [Bifidobacterium primatium]|uniref:THUMP-like domain-containing protein n=1 Tax=Bifidobacterium primatium TaxID=2045438 RepID=UPI001A9CA433|nr:SAM-dependent methyltransferase [Bifidobacterium primatium]
MDISPETREFIRAHRDGDVRDLALHAKAGDGVDMTTALEQIDGWQRARTKLLDWTAHDGIIYPPHISMEQCSSQTTALYKADVARRLMASADPTGNGTTTPFDTAASPADTTLIDLTGGFGVDFSYMARAFSRGIYVERQSHLCEVAEHNMAALGLTSVRVVNADSTKIIVTGAYDADPSVTMIFVDPARRDSHGARTYAIADCTPDVIALEPLLLDRARYVMVKLSPMLDWRKAVHDLGGVEFVREVHIVSTGNECKELLIVLGGSSDEHVGDGDGSDGDGINADNRHIRMYCVNDSNIVEYHIDESGEIIDIGNDDENIDDAENAIADDADSADAGATDDAEYRYLYEPNASIMKAGCFTLIERRYGVRQIGANSHLFVSDRPVTDFPGRAFAVDAVTGMGKRELKTVLAGVTHANIATRNFPMNVAALRRKLKVKDGGSTYIFATTDAERHHVLLITRKMR